jgi:hypothetical protein
MQSQQDVQPAQGAAVEPGLARLPVAEGRQRRLVVRGIELVAVARFLGSRRFLERTIVGAVALAALARLARDNEARAVSRFIAWDRRRILAPQLPAQARRRVAR